MSDKHPPSDPDTGDPEPTVALDDDRAEQHDSGDDERDSRDQIARTGEPRRDALGNSDGAS